MSEAVNVSLVGRRALVCGASGGIGRAIALCFARQGAALTILARRQAQLEIVCDELMAAGAAGASLLVCDLGDREQLSTLVQAQIEQAGPFDVLVNNSAGPAAGMLLDAEALAFQEAFERHVLAAQTLVSLLLPGMKNVGYGRIVNIISTSVREPIAMLGVSNTIRSAMAAWAKSLSKELPPGITINNVLPGFTATDRLEKLAKSRAQHLGTTVDAVKDAWIDTVPEGRVAEPSEIAAAVAFLASPAASYIRGVSLPVDGGRLQGI